MSTPSYTKFTNPAARTPGLVSPFAVWDLIQKEVNKLDIPEQELPVESQFWKTSGTSYVLGNVEITSTTNEEIHFSTKVRLDEFNVANQYYFPTSYPATDNQDRLLVFPSDTNPLQNQGYFELPSVILSGEFWNTSGSTSLDNGDVFVNLLDSAGQKLTFQTGLAWNAGYQFIEFERNIKLRFKETEEFATNWITVGAQPMGLDIEIFWPKEIVGTGVNNNADLATQGWVNNNYLTQAAADAAYAPITGSVNYWKTIGNNFITGTTSIKSTTSENVDFESTIDVNIHNLQIADVMIFPTSVPGSDVYLLELNGAGPAPYTFALKTATDILSGTFWNASGSTTLTGDVFINIGAGNELKFQGGSATIPAIRLSNSADGSGLPLRFQQTNLGSNYTQLLAQGTIASNYTALLPSSDTGSASANTLATQGYVDANAGVWSESGSNIYFNTGFVGIGTSSPGAKLHIQYSSGDTGAPGSNEQLGMLIENTNSTSNTRAQLQLRSSNYDAYIYGSYDGVANTGKLHFAVDNLGNTKEALTITNTGNVGIGTASPSSILHISAGTSGDALVIIEADTDNNNENDNPFISFRQDNSATTTLMGQNGDAGQNYSGSLSNAFFVETQQTNPIQFATNGTARVTIEGGGDVGIGLTNPTEKLHVSGNVKATDLIATG